jgi:hypothetical protein
MILLRIQITFHGTISPSPRMTTAPSDAKKDNDKKRKAVSRLIDLNGQ